MLPMRAPSGEEALVEGRKGLDEKVGIARSSFGVRDWRWSSQLAHAEHGD